MFAGAREQLPTGTWTPLVSADPGLRQGWGCAWDHRRCGTLAVAKQSRQGLTTFLIKLFQCSQDFTRLSRPATWATAVSFYRRPRLPFASRESLKQHKTFRSSFQQIWAAASCFYPRSGLPLASHEKLKKPEASRGGFPQPLGPTYSGSLHQPLGPQHPHRMG